MAYIVAEQIGPFWVGDVPLTPSVLTLVDRDGNDVDLSNVVTPSASVAGQDVPISVVGDTLVVDWPIVTLFTVEGIHTLEIKLAVLAYPSAVEFPANDQFGFVGYVTVEPSEFVIQALTGWHTLDTARREWRDAPDSDSGLFVLLDTARVQVEAFAPKTAVGSPVPLRYKQAQLMQARNVWNAAKADPAGQLGDEGFAIRPFPMDWTVKNIIRPKNPVPVVA